MSGPKSFRLSQETRDLLRQHQDFYASVLSLYDGKGGDPKKTPLILKPSDAEARTEAELKGNGDLEVTLVIPLDNNESPDDGRVYLKDKFLFDPTQKVLKSYRRSFEHNAKGDAAAWQGWLGKYEALLKEAPTVHEALVQRFGLTVARSHGQAVVDEQEKTLPKLALAFKREHRYLDSLDALIQAQGERQGTEGLRLRIKEKENFYQLIRQGERIDLVLNVAVDVDGEPENGRIWLKDRFSLISGKMASLDREWSLDPSSAGNAEYEALLQSLKRQNRPDLDEAKAFVENLYPEIVPQGNPDPQDLIPLLAAGMKGPKTESVLQGRWTGGPELESAQGEVLGILEGLAHEDVAKRADHAQGLLSFTDKVDVVAEQQNLTTLFVKLKAAQAKAKGAPLKALLESLELSEAESAQRQKILRLRAFSELNSLAQERNPELRHSGLLHLAEGRLFVDQGYPATALAIAELAQKTPGLQGKAQRLLDLGQGKGSFGAKAENTLGHFHKEVTKPSMVLGMMAAPFAGAAFEAGGLRFAKFLLDAKKIQNIGTGTKLGASGFGMLGEAAAFTGVHRSYERLGHSSETAWKDADKEVLSSLFLFAGMRSVHAGGAWTGSRMAEGKLNFSVRGREIRFGGRDGTAAYSPAVAKATPTGRWMMGNPWVPEAGVGAPALTRLGRVSAGTINHGGGILAMQGSGWLSRQVGLAPDTGQGFGGNFFDATVMYTHAMLGFSLANKASMGRLQPALGEAKMRIHGFDPKARVTVDFGEAAAVPARPSKPPASSAKPGGPFELAPIFKKLFVKPEGEASGQGFGGRMREGLGKAGEWFANLKPSRVKALETQLSEVQAKQSAAEAEVASKAAAITSLETKVQELTGELSQARGEVQNHQSDAQSKATRLREVEGELSREQQQVAEKDRELGETQKRLQRAEGKLQKIEENAEAADLGLEFTDPQAEIQALRERIQILGVEKGEAEVRASALEQSAQGLRAQIDEAQRELKRREGLDAALSDAKAQVNELTEAKTRLEQSIEALNLEISGKSAESESASKLVTSLAEQLSEIKALKEKVDQALEAKAAEAVALKEKVEKTAGEAQLLADRLAESDAELRGAKQKLETQEARVQSLERHKTRLERQKTELEGQLEGKGSEAAGLAEKLAATEKSLDETARELKTSRKALETAEGLKKSKDEENGRLRQHLLELQSKRDETEQELRTSIRDLEQTVKSKSGEIEKAQAELEGLRQDLERETHRAAEAEGQAAAWQLRHAELKAEHDKTTAELSDLQRRMSIADRDIAGLKGQLERTENSRKELQDRLEAMRGRKSEVDKELTEKKAAIKTLEERLKETERLLEEERNAEPVIDIEREVELEEQISNLQSEKSGLESRVQQLEKNGTELGERFQALEGQKREAERQLRLKQTDLELAENSAKDLHKDLAELQARSQTEAQQLRENLEQWRQRATSAESEKAQAETRLAGLTEELGRKNQDIERLSRTLNEKTEELGAAQEKAKVLSDEIQGLGEENGTLQQRLLSKETELESARADAQGQIDGLTREKGEQARKIEAKKASIEKLKGEVAEQREKVSDVERQLRESKDETRKEHRDLEEVKRSARRELEAKSQELESLQTELSQKEGRIEALDAELARARQEAQTEKRRLESEKGELQEKLEGQDAELGTLRGNLAESQALAKELERQLNGAREELAAEKSALAQLKGQHEEMAARNQIEVERLQDQANRAETAAAEAQGLFQEESRRAGTLESAIQEVKATAEREAQEASQQVQAADQRAGRSDRRAAEASRELEALKTSSAAEAESLRQEAATASTEAAKAKAVLEELRRRAEVSEQSLATLEARLKTAEAEAEALRAPASQRQAAEVTAAELRGRLAVAEEGLRAAEAKAQASAERVKQLESELAAQRSAGSEEAILHQKEAEAHEAKARAAEARVEAAEERATAAEARVQEQQVRAEAAELREREANTKVQRAEREAARARSDADRAKNQTEALRERGLRIQALEGDLGAAKTENIELDRNLQGANSRIQELETKAQSLEARAREAEGRAEQAETRAEQAEKLAAEWEIQIEQMAGNLRQAKEAEQARAEQVEGLLKARSETEHQIAQLNESLAALEKQGLEHIAKRRELDGKLSEASQRVGELEKTLQEREGEIERLKSEMTTVWQQGQKIGQGSREQQEAAQRRIEELNDQVSVLTEDLRVARDAEHTVELLAASEKELERQVQGLSSERRKLQRRIRDLEGQIAALPQGYFGHFFDPRSERVPVRLEAVIPIGDAAGKPIGEGMIRTGGAEGDLALGFADGSKASARTSKGLRQYQEDGAYLGRYVLPDGREVKVLAGADGAGGEGGGDVASSAFLQGVHARLVDTARAGQMPSAADLFAHGETALAKQKEGLPPEKKATGAGSVVVIVGHEATVASKGDANVLWARPGNEGEFEVLGLTETDSWGQPGPRKYNQLVRGLGLEDHGSDSRGPHHYRITDLRPGDRFIVASDGFHGSLIGPELAEGSSPTIREMRPELRELSQETFGALRQGLKLSAGRENVAQAWHDLAVAHMRQPQGEQTFFGETLKIPPHENRDNVFVIDYEQGGVTPNTTSVIPKGYADLPRVPSLAEARKQASLSVRPTRKNLDSPPPPLPKRSKAAIEGEFFKKYVNALSEVYGTLSEQGSIQLSPSARDAAKQFVELYHRYPELEAQLNPDLLTAATDRQSQVKLFDGAKKFLQDVEPADSAKSLAAQEILKTIQGFRKVFERSGPQEQAEVLSRYGISLERIFGSRTEEAARQFADLFKSAPETEAAFNPNSLVSNEAFQRAYFLNEVQGRIRNSGKAPQKATPQEVADLHAKYSEALQSTFGPDAPIAAQYFADLFKTDPAAEKTYHPGKLSSPKFFQKLIVLYHPDRLRLTDEVSADGPAKTASSLKALFENPEVLAERKPRGWLSPESLATGFRSWTLEPQNGQEYVGGRRADDILLEDSTVSRHHFSVSFQGKTWYLEEKTEARNGTFVNNNVLKNKRKHALKPGDRLRFGLVELEWSVDGQGRGVLKDVVPQSFAPQGPTSSMPPPPVSEAARSGAAPHISSPPPSPASGGLTFAVPKGKAMVLGHEQIPDFGVAQDHVSIHWDGQRWIIQDRGSSYGTQLNGEEIAAQVLPRGRPAGKQFELKHGDQVKLGNVFFRFDVLRNGFGQLVQTGGSIIPPSSRIFRPSPQYSSTELKEGENRPLMDMERKIQIGAIEWDPRHGQFVLRNMLPNTQIWMLNQGQIYPLTEACLLGNGTIFGIGPNSREAQFFIFQDRVITAVNLQGAPRIDSPAVGTPAPIHLEYVASENSQGIQLGRQHFRNHNTVSGEHLQFHYHEGTWWVRDTASTNGTYLDGSPIFKGNPQAGQKEVGDWHKIEPGNILGIGSFNLRFNSEGGRFSLDEIPQGVTESPYVGPASGAFPSSYRPSPTSGARQPTVDMSQLAGGQIPLSLGDARNIVVTQKSEQVGIFPTDPDQPLTGDYYLNIGAPKRWQLFGSRDLFRLERLDEKRYRLTNIGVKGNIEIVNERGKRISVAPGGNDLVFPGDSLQYDKMNIAVGK